MIEWVIASTRGKPRLSIRVEVREEYEVEMMNEQEEKEEVVEAEIVDVKGSMTDKDDHMRL